MKKQFTFKRYITYLKLMAKINDLAKEYADYALLMRKNKADALIEITLRIKSLTYSENGLSISIEDKEKLLNEMERLLKAPHGRIVEAEDIKDLMIMVQNLRDALTK